MSRQFCACTDVREPTVTRNEDGTLAITCVPGSVVPVNVEVLEEFVVRHNALVRRLADLEALHPTEEP